MATALANQKTPLVNHVSEKAATIQNASRRMLPVNPRVARETANLEKMKTPPQKHQKKMILNFDATFAKATDVEAAVNLMATALGNQKTPLLNHVSEKAATIQNASRRMLPVNPRVARETANLAKMKTPPQKHQKKMILNFDATFAKATDVVAAVNLMATALGNQKTPLVNHVSEKAAAIQQRMMSLVNHVMIAKIAENVKIVVILTTLLMNYQLLQFLLDDSFEKKQNDLLTQPRSLVTERETLALVKIANVDERAARVAENHEKVKMPLQKHLKMFLRFDVLLDEMVDANAERVLTRQSLTD